MRPRQTTHNDDNNNNIDNINNKNNDNIKAYTYNIIIIYANAVIIIIIIYYCGAMLRHARDRYIIICTLTNLPT